MLYPLIAVVGAAAYYDYKDKRIPDVITAIGWLMLLFAWGFYADSAPLLIAGASFAILFPINAFLALKDKHVLSWGDILLIPVYVGYASSTTFFTTMLLAPIASLFIYVAITGKNKKVALAPFLFFSVLISLVL